MPLWREGKRVQQLFGANIKPCCSYCEHAYPAAERGGDVRLCVKKGVVPAGGSCRAFRYDPIMRIPHRPPQVEKLPAEEFTL